MTTPENRQTVIHYDENTGLAERTEVSGLHDTVYSYYADGRIENVTVGTRTTGFLYDLASDPKTVTVSSAAGMSGKKVSQGKVA